MSYRIEFRNVGRAKKTWRCVVRELSFSCLSRALAKGRALMSRDIMFSLPEHDDPGRVFAGMHDVGQWVILDSAALRAQHPAPAGDGSATAAGGAGDSLQQGER